MKILFYQRTDVIESSGGTEKVLCFLTSALAEKGHNITFITNENKKGKPFFTLSNKVKFINIGGTLFCGFKKIIFKLIKSTPILDRLPFFNNYKHTSDIAHKYITDEKPDLIILANPQDLFEICYSHTYNIPIIQMIHNVPWNIFHRKSKTILKKTLNLMKNINVCQVLMPSFVELIKPYYNGKVVIIPNSIPTTSDNFICDYSDKKDKFIITSIARITPVKNQELIIKAFSKIHAKNPKWEVNFWGGEDIEYKEELILLINKLGLQNKIIFKGKTKQPLEEMKNADIFAFPSHFEGFGVALGEAMACGLPSIALKTAPAVNELIIDGKNGILSDNNVDIFAQDLEILMSNAKLRKKMGKTAKEMIKDYSEDKIIEMWEKLIKDTVKGSSIKS